MNFAFAYCERRALPFVMDTFQFSQLQNPSRESWTINLKQWRISNSLPVEVEVALQGVSENRKIDYLLFIL